MSTNNKLPSVRASTYASYEGQVRRYIIPAIGRIKLGKLTPAHIQHLYREMQDRGLSTRTVQYTHAVLRRALKQAKRWGMVDRNVAEDVDPPRLKRGEIQPLDREQTRRRRSGRHRTHTARSGGGQRREVRPTVEWRHGRLRQWRQRGTQRSRPSVVFDARLLDRPGRGPHRCPLSALRVDASEVGRETLRRRSDLRTGDHR